MAGITGPRIGQVAEYLVETVQGHLLEMLEIPSESIKLPIATHQSSYAIPLGGNFSVVESRDSAALGEEKLISLPGANQKPLQYPFIMPSACGTFVSPICEKLECNVFVAENFRLR